MATLTNVDAISTGLITAFTKNKQNVVIKEIYLSVANVVLMSQQKWKDSGQAFLGETLGFAILYSGASEIVCGTKLYEYFLETIPEKQTIKVLDVVRSLVKETNLNHSTQPL